MPELKRLNVVAGLLFRDGRLLVCQRHRHGSFPLKWEFPGGKIEANEAPIDALRRELREELAIEVGGAKLVFTHEHAYTDGPIVTLSFFYVGDWQGDAQNLVFERICWRELRQLSGLDFLDGDRVIVKELMGAAGVRLLS